MGDQMLQENFLHLPVISSLFPLFLSDLHFTLHQSPSAPDSLLKLSIVLDLFGGSGIDPGNSTSLFVFDTCRVRHVGGRAIAEQIAYRLPRIPQPTQSAFLFAAKPRQVSREDNGHGDFTRVRITHYIASHSTHALLL
jgi:hypothetical protein